MTLLKNIWLFIGAVGCDFREHIQEPTLDVGVSEGLAVTFRQQAHFIILVPIRKPSTIVTVRQNIVFHPIIGQTPVCLFAGVSLDMTLRNCIIGIVLPYSLKKFIFITSGVYCFSGKRPADPRSGQNRSEAAGL